MSLSSLLSDLVDLERHKHRAKMKRALREKEMRVLNDLSKWDRHALNKKKRLQRKCLRIAEHYLMLGKPILLDNHSFEFVLNRLALWHQKVEATCSADELIKELVIYIQEIKYKTILKNDQIKLYKLGVLYHQLSLINITGLSRVERLQPVDALQDWTDLLRGEKGVYRFTDKLLTFKKQGPSTFCVNMATMLARASLEIRSVFLHYFFSNPLTEFVHLLGACAYEPQRLFPEERSSHVLLRLKQTAHSIHDCYYDLWQVLKPFQDAKINHAFCLPVSTYQKIHPSFSNETLNVLKSYLLAQGDDIQNKRPELSDYAARLSLIELDGERLAQWFDLIIAVSKLDKWQSLLVSYLKTASIEELLSVRNQFAHDSVNEIVSVIQHHSSHVKWYAVIHTTIHAMIEMYLKEIQHRLTLIEPEKCNVIPYHPTLETKHHEFFKRLEVVYGLEQKQLGTEVNALFESLDVF